MTYFTLGSMSHRVTRLMQQSDRLERLIEYIGAQEYDQDFDSFLNATGQFFDYQVELWSIPLKASTRALGSAIGLVSH